MTAIRDRPWLLPVGAAAIAVCLFIGGVIVWRIVSPEPFCPPNTFCALQGPPHRLHPLRAEALWAASGLFAITAAAISVRLRLLREHAPATA
jgi:hypothetical protein